MNEKGAIGSLSSFVIAMLFVAGAIGFVLIGGFDVQKNEYQNPENEIYTPIIEIDKTDGKQSLQLKKIEFNKEILECFKTTAINFVLDRSGSMVGNKIQILKQGTKTFIATMSDESLVGMQTFGGDAQLEFEIDKLGERRNNINEKIDSLKPKGGTPMKAGLEIAKNELAKTMPNHKDYSFSLILLSDGMWNTGGDPTDIINEIKAMNVRIFTIAYGSREIIDFMKKSASSESDSYYAPGNEQITEILNQIAKEICPAK